MLTQDPVPAEEEDGKDKRTDDISSWDADFLKVDQGTLFELILVSPGPHLLHLTDWLLDDRRLTIWT